MTSKKGSKQPFPFGPRPDVPNSPELDPLDISGGSPDIIKIPGPVNPQKPKKPPKPERK